MDNIEFYLYRNGFPLFRGITDEVIFEMNEEDIYEIEREPNGKLTKITTFPPSEPLKIRFEGIITDMDIFEELKRTREGL